MDITLLLEFQERRQLREWLQENHPTAKDCWVVTSRRKNPPPGLIPYIEVVEEALCFGWIDSTLKRLPDGRLAQWLSPPQEGQPLDRTQQAEVPGTRKPRSYDPGR